ncbi:unnamed protein product [Brassicogethes aeneus]|uniref:Uncharacterized protein n=1 Tax=Brassicogethes aeneus TaxID=1431903 RepID=A0A9P0B510_BRAAE|nr:unnamed protein product [Brassicogethes aeneus]
MHSFVGVEFQDGSVALVHEYYYEALKRGEQPSCEDNREIHSVLRIFFETDDYEKARKKLKLAEIQLDAQTDDASKEVRRTISMSSLKKIPYKHRYPVGSRQTTRRVAETVKNITEEINIQIKKNNPEYLNVESSPPISSDSSSEENDSYTESSFPVLTAPVNEDLNFSGTNFDHDSFSEPLDVFANANHTKKAEPVNLSGQLRQWVVRKNVSPGAVTELLHILSRLHPELPLDCRTLLQTPSKMTISRLITVNIVILD